MSPRHLSHNKLAELAAIPFEAMPEHAAAHIAQCTHCADDYALACEELNLTASALAAATTAGWQPPIPAAVARPWGSAISLAVGIVVATYTAPGWSVHLASISLIHTARLFAGGARWCGHMAEASPLFLLPLACLAFALSRSPQGDAHV